MCIKKVILYFSSYINNEGSNYDLNQTAINSGVKDLAKFHNARYKGLYNGETAADIVGKKET